LLQIEGDGLPYVRRTGHSDDPRLLAGLASLCRAKSGIASV
jgi:hypothetical protein